MQAVLLPLFPLPLVLFPRTPLPLHIFEDRYKEMIGEALRDETEFGIVLARERAILNTGCTATISRVLERYDDGRLDILTVGRRRFEVLSLDQERSFLRGEVEFFDDEAASEQPPPDLRDRALAVHKLLVELGEEAVEPALDDPQVSFQLANIIEDVDFRQQVLTLRSETDRLRTFLTFSRDYIPKRRAIAHLKRVQPLNGHRPGGLPDEGHA